MRKNEEAALYVQFGCGPRAPEGWRNFDVIPILRFGQMPIIGRFLQRVVCSDMYRWWKGRAFPINSEYGDIVKGLPIPDKSCKALYCSHVLHHLALEELRKALKNSFRILQNGGVFRLVMPDLEYLARRYLADTNADAAYHFMRSSCLGYVTYPTTFAALMKAWLTKAHRHRRKWMWDYKSLVEELRAAGFVDIRRAEIGDSGDPMFGLVEDPSRWNERSPESDWWEKGLAIQCRKQTA